MDTLNKEESTFKSKEFKLKNMPMFIVPVEPSYYFKNDLCYTEDHVLVHEIYLCDIPAKLTEDELLIYFNSFGTVVGLQLQKQHKKLKTGCVLFADPLDAAKVLHKQIHYLSDHRFQVNASNSWLQPEAYTTSEQSHITKIPDDCLVRILEFLPLMDQLQFLRHCSFYRDVYNLDTRHLHKSVFYYMPESLTIWQMREFFFIFGDGIQSFRDDLGRCERFYKFLGLNCVNLKCLELCNTRLSPKNMFKIFSKTNKLENLRLNRCDLNGNSLVNLKNLQQLKYLSLYDNPNLSGYLDLPVSLETLDLSRCFKIPPNNLLLTLKDLTNLKNLDITEIPKINPNVYEYLLSLETLHLDIEMKTNYNKIAMLPNLKRIKINDITSTETFSQFLDELARNARQLEELIIRETRVLNSQLLMQISQLGGLRKLALFWPWDINESVLQEFAKLKKLESFHLSDCQHVNDASMLHMVIGCPKLREVNLNYCYKITESLVFGIIENVRRKILTGVNERKLPIHLHVRATYVKDSIQSDSEVASGEIIKIFF
ncbi:uncharacterized protein LOC111519590 [Drosophila willistoni]|uniref:uncharacterized protein LOC111519590 n=1 Tax=Drosophila willistoni TaxID=7260 RepID=UPI001F083875|nr:uncharacterized protein LOC111519590 [Drosophila willistoni]